jgi:hypothetical protein
MKAVDRRLGGDMVNERGGRVRKGVEGRRMRHRRAVSSRPLAAKGDVAAEEIFLSLRVARSPVFVGASERGRDAGSSVIFTRNQSAE